MTAAPVKRLARNLVGRDLIVGDIHGCFGKLQATLDEAGFNSDAGDRLISVGDLVDRGPDSHLALEWLARPWFHAVCGNHEEAAGLFAIGELSAGMYAQGFGGAWFIGMTPTERLPYLDAFAALPVAIELETEAGLVGVVHADCPVAHWHELEPMLRMNLPAESAFALSMRDRCMWSRDRADKGLSSWVGGVRAVVVGHTPFERWTTLGNTIFIDTFGWRQGHFTLLDAHTLQPLRSTIAATKLLEF